MEKLIYLLWKPPSQAIGSFRDEILTCLSAKLSDAGAGAMHLAIADNDVDAASDKRIISALTAAQATTAPDALLSFWLHSASTRSAIEGYLHESCQALCGYLVTESEPLLNTQTLARGERTSGMNQVVLLRQPARLSRSEWLELWLNQHTPIAIATQSTFGYRQNVVARILTDNSLSQNLAIDAIVEENFPPAAMSSAHAFYKAVDDKGNNDDALLRENQKAMFGSVLRFIDLDKLDCLPMSEYSL